MEGKNESKHTPEDNVAIRVPNIRIPAGYSRDISAAILDYQSECNAILKEQTKRIKELEGRIRVETLLFEQLSETKKELDELRAEVDRLTKEKSELRESLEYIYNTLSSDDTLIVQFLPRCDSSYKPSVWLSKTKNLLTRIK